MRTPLVIAAVLIFFSIMDANRPYDSTDANGVRSGMAIYTDALTGCQYLGAWFGGLTPRLDREGKQMCDGQ